MMNELYEIKKYKGISYIKIEGKETDIGRHIDCPRISYFYSFYEQYVQVNGLFIPGSRWTENGVVKISTSQVTSRH
jgi:hypothetical protein